ncbi:Beta-barrel assembly-enhancing protease [compost metagenome]
MQKLLPALLLFCSITGQLYAQHPDSLFSKARTLAADKSYPESISVMQQLHSNYPDNADYTVYLSRLYFWNNDPEQAARTLKTICNDESCGNREALDLLIRVALAQKNTDEAIRLAAKGSVLFPEEQHQYFLLKAQALEQAGNDAAAIAVLDSIAPAAPNHHDAKYLLTTILKKQKNMVSAAYMQTGVSQPQQAAQHFAYVEYKRSFKTHTQLFRLNYVTAYDKSSFMLESDAYVKLHQKNYVYLNAGVSDKRSVFPAIKLGAEYYQEDKHFSASLGGRYLYFDAGSNAVLLTGHIAGTAQSWTLNYRPFVLLQQHKTLVSHVAYLRRSFENSESYIQLDAQYGNLPYFFYTTDLFSRLSAYRVGLSGKLRLCRNYFVQPVFMLEKEEYVPDTYRNRYTVQLILSKRF